ncbi:MAG: nuclear pore complex subunit [Bacteroidetes bacterium]|nr:MAG: nuclear pore complex subunit [Bacteroidota bacterium]
MDNLIIEGTRQTPEINFDVESGILKLEGRSIPENTFEFFTPVLNWLDAYVNSSPDKIVAKINLEYFNTSSSKYILEILKKLKVFKVEGTEVLVEWYYEEDDEEMMETGEDYEDVSGLPFEIISFEEE